jgi:hypothetical protein
MTLDVSGRHLCTIIKVRTGAIKVTMEMRSGDWVFSQECMKSTVSVKKWGIPGSIK